MGNILSNRPDEDEFINEVIYKLRRNGIKMNDDYNRIIEEEEVIMTLKGIYRREPLSYYFDLRCKPKMLELYMPNWWRY